ncbi:MAG: response regulator [Burkholderiaceae bacterium]
MNRTLLVCDDDRLVLMSITAALRQAGYQVYEADSGDDAILLARQHRPDLVILDIRMDGKTGFDVAAYFRDYLDQPFVFLTACSNPEEISEGMAHGALAYFIKPIETPRLLQEVDKALQRLEARAEPKQSVRSLLDGEQTRDHQHWVAAGILMVTEQLDLHAAVGRLGDLARADGVSMLVAANRVVQALGDWTGLAHDPREAPDERGEAQND